MKKNPKVSIVIPVYEQMKNGPQFLWDCINSVLGQSFQDFEIVLTRKGTMPENTNEGIRRSRGELIKVLYMDDRFAHEDALGAIVGAMEAHPDKEWLINGCDDNQFPFWTDDIETGNNKLGSPTCLAIRNRSPMLFDERITWLLDCDYYKRMHEEHGDPIILPGIHVRMGIGDHQLSARLSQEEKDAEVNYLHNKNQS